MSKEPGFVVNKTTIAFVMALISLLGVGWKVTNYFADFKMKDQQQDLRLDQQDKDQARATAATEKLSDKTDALTNAVTRLTAVIEASPATRKAEIGIPRPTLPASMSLETVQ